MTLLRLSCIAGIAALTPACSGEGGDEPLPTTDSVLTYNIYLGADIAEPLTATSMGELAGRVEAAFATFEANDFAQRAEAIADRIAVEQPTLIGLQEVVTIYIQRDGDRFAGGFTPATELVIDFEQVLLAALTARGLDYRVAVRSELSDVEVPSASGEDIRLIDHDVILVQGGVTVGFTEANRYEARIPIPMPDGASTNEIIRGFVAAVVTLQGTPTLFVNTHMETSRGEPIQLAQAAELIAWLADRTEPVILVGDFNSEADPAESTQTYDLIETAGFTDAWELRADPTEPGFTCCHASDLRNATPQFHERIDLIWVLGVLPAGTPEVHLIGEEQTDRTRGGLWPSNHAGVIMTFP